MQTESLKKTENFLSLTVYFVEKCYRDDPEIDECLRFSGNKLASYLHEGIPELELVDVEPVIIDGKEVTYNFIKRLFNLGSIIYYAHKK